MRKWISWEDDFLLLRNLGRRWVEVAWSCFYFVFFSWQMKHTTRQLIVMVRNVDTSSRIVFKRSIEKLLFFEWRQTCDGCVSDLRKTSIRCRWDNTWNIIMDILYSPKITFSSSSSLRFVKLVVNSFKRQIKEQHHEFLGGDICINLHDVSSAHQQMFRKAFES